MPTKREPKPKNQLGLFAGMDTEIESTQHDDIMLWLDCHAEQIIAALFPYISGPVWATDAVYLNTHDPEDLNRVYWRPVAMRYPCNLPKPSARITEKKWESPILGPKDSLVGFADMRAVVEYPYIMHAFKDGQAREDDIKQAEARILFEVKTSIKLGALIRQINLYKMHCPSDSYFVVVSPDTRYVDTLAEQEIYFVEYPHIPGE